MELFCLKISNFGSIYLKTKVYEMIYTYASIVTQMTWLLMNKKIPLKTPCCNYCTQFYLESGSNIWNPYKSECILCT